MDIDKNHYIGSFIGQAVGDALGFPMEGRLPEECRTYVDEVLKKGKVRGPKVQGFKFGQYSDDTQLAREILLGFRERGKFEPEDFARRLAELFDRDEIVGRSYAVEVAARRLLNGSHWSEAGVSTPTAGNGSAMRAGVVGLLFYDSPGKLIQAAYDQGRITHTDPRSTAGAVAIAGAVALVLQGKMADPEEFLSQLSRWVSIFDEHLAGYILKLKDWIRFPPNTAVIPISRAGVDQAKIGKLKGISSFVMGSVLWSMYSFLRTPKDYMQTLYTAIAVGGDVDTIAAMAGAVSGAYNGLDAIPLKYARRLTDRGRWGYNELVRLAEEVYEIKQTALVESAGPETSYFH